MQTASIPLAVIDVNAKMVLESKKESTIKTVLMLMNASKCLDYASKDVSIIGDRIDVLVKLDFGLAKTIERVKVNLIIN